jgi:hypothetical protein
MGLMIFRAARLLIYLWVLPTTLIGLPFLITALFDGEARCVNGVLEIHGRVTSFFLRRVAGLMLPNGASAMTLGHIVIGRDREMLDRTRRHERVHVRQCEWFGPFFVVAYLLCSVVVLLMGRDAYRANPFERQAFGIDERVGGEENI